MRKTRAYVGYHRKVCQLILKRKAFIRFAFIGSFCASLNLASLYVMVSHWKWNYIIATTIAWFLINLLGFCLNKYYTFVTPNVAFFQELWKYYMVMLSSFFMNLLLMFILVDILLVWYLYASLVITIGFLIYNFLLHKHWSFR